MSFPERIRTPAMLQTYGDESTSRPAGHFQNSIDASMALEDERRFVR
jgi:hypothetical protein